MKKNERREQTLGGASEPESLAAVDADPDDRLTLFFSAPTGFFISLPLLSRRVFFFRFFLQIQRFFCYKTKTNNSWFTVNPSNSSRKTG